MADKNPYGLRNADIENLDLSEFAKDFSKQELAAVRAGLLQKRQEQQEKFNALPVFDQAKVYAGEKFGELKKAVEEDPLLLAAPFAAKAAIDTGTSVAKGAKSLYDRMVTKPVEAAQAPVAGSAPTTQPVTQNIPETTNLSGGTALSELTKKYEAKGFSYSDALDKALEEMHPTQIFENKPTSQTPTPENIPTAEQATKEMVESGKLKGGKEFGSISPIDATIEGNVITGKAKAEVAGAVNPPEGYIANYMQGKKKKSGAFEYKNKQGSDVLGKGGWNWYQGQMGPEAERNWLQTFGRTNQSYEDVKQAIKEGRLKGPEVVEGKGGSFKREPIVPNYIKGAASAEMLARTGLGALGVMPVAQKIKEGDYKGALNELIPAMAMISPALSLAASPLYTSEEEIATLKKAERGRKVGAGRGIAPPSDYMR